MHTAEKELIKAAKKIAKWYRDDVRLEVIPNAGFVLRGMDMSEKDSGPVIGVVNNDLVGAQDDFDWFLKLIGYEAQVERILFDASKAKFVLDTGWSGKYWRKEQTGDFTVDAIVTRLPQKVSALAVCLIASVYRESRRRTGEKVKSWFRGKQPKNPR